MGTEPSWYPDPHERSEHRYWDGDKWTVHIEHLGHEGVEIPDKMEATKTTVYRPRIAWAPVATWGGIWILLAILMGIGTATDSDALVVAWALVVLASLVFYIRLLSSRAKESGRNFPWRRLALVSLFALIGTSYLGSFFASAYERFAPETPTADPTDEVADEDGETLEAQALELCEIMEDEVVSGDAQGPLFGFVRNSTTTEESNPTISRLIAAMRSECSETVDAWDGAAAESALTPEEERAVELCVQMDDQIAVGDVDWHLNTFLDRNAGRVNVVRLLTAMRAECSSTVNAYEEAYSAEFRRQMEESSADRADDDPWWEEIPQPLGPCFRDYYEADYLSPQALSAATCITDELAFGGTTPTDDALRNLTGEILFHATWATWDDATRRVQCQPVKQRGFDAAEELGIATIRVWNDQLAGAGANKQFDDYAVVLDFLDVCEIY